MTTDSKSFLLISRSSPYGGSAAREALDLAFAAGAFNQDFAVLFMDDGVYQLVKGQDTEALAQKNLASTLPMLELYGASTLYAERSSLERRGLTPEDLVLPVDLVTTVEMGELVSSADVVFSG